MAALFFNKSRAWEHISLYALNHLDFGVYTVSCSYSTVY